MQSAGGATLTLSFLFNSSLHQVQREKKLQALLDGAGLGQYEGPLIDFGIESVEDLTNFRIVNDDLLMSEDIGMSKEDVRTLRRALERHFYAE